LVVRRFGEKILAVVISGRLAADTAALRNDNSNDPRTDPPLGTLMAELGKVLIVAGVLAIVAGVAFVLLGRAQVPLGRLPGDLVFRGKNTTFYFPLATSILISVVLSLVLYLVGRFRR
jgi:hypothetical protein